MVAIPTTVGDGEFTQEASEVEIEIDAANSFLFDDGYVWSYWQINGLPTEDTSISHERSLENEGFLACDPSLAYEDGDVVIHGKTGFSGHGDDVEIRIPEEIVEWGWGNIGEREDFEEDYVEEIRVNPYLEEFETEMLKEDYEARDFGDVPVSETKIYENDNGKTYEYSTNYSDESEEAFLRDALGEVIDVEDITLVQEPQGNSLFSEYEVTFSGTLDPRELPGKTQVRTNVIDEIRHYEIIGFSEDGTLSVRAADSVTSE